mgnify:CR=1 FL=1
MFLFSRLFLQASKPFLHLSPRVSPRFTLRYHSATLLQLNYCSKQAQISTQRIGKYGYLFECCLSFLFDNSTRRQLCDISKILFSDCTVTFLSTLAVGLSLLDHTLFGSSSLDHTLFESFSQFSLDHTLFESFSQRWTFILHTVIWWYLIPLVW